MAIQSTTMPRSHGLPRSAQSCLSKPRLLTPLTKTPSPRTFTTTPRKPFPQTDVHALLSTPNWSVRSLLPSHTSTPQQTITPTTLHHLLRLSSLPPPATPALEASLLSTLHTQLHFVRAIQSVNTAGIAPLTAICDESSTSSTTITLDSLRETLAGEKSFGFRGRPRRLRGAERDRARSAEEVLVEERTRPRREGAYYVVESGTAKGCE